ncbi:MAG TPA: hypothetical protein VLN58_04935, partial [Verrucomicrobiae bacterium]|nr:hypothetical protein [Verrucomicrobiae bacterium]
TRTLGSCCRANFPSTASSAAGLSLLAQPAAFTCSVRRMDLMASAIEAFYLFRKGIYRNERKGREGLDWVDCRSPSLLQQMVSS